MRILKVAFIYFVAVFSTGFALAFVRIPFLVPAFGVRTAELMEVPLMLAVIVWLSRAIVRRNRDLPRVSWLAAGVVAFAFLAMAELTLAYLLGAASPSQYIASRDPVSGTVYLAALVFFALAPALWKGVPGQHISRSTGSPLDQPRRRL